MCMQVGCVSVCAALNFEMLAASALQGGRFAEEFVENLLGIDKDGNRVY